MYQLENIIKTNTRTLGDKLNIILLCDNEEDYINILCETGHNFYIFKELYPSQWKRENIPPNLRLGKNPHYTFQKSYDLIIAFNRLGQWEKANMMSRAWHLPLIVVDIASNASKIQHPFFTNLSIDRPEALYHRNGAISVGSQDLITNSWLSQFTRLAHTIPIPHNPIVRQVSYDSNTKIAIDSDLPQQYINSLPLVLSNDLYTTSLSEAAFYLHLWQTITPKMLEAMALGIPVITLQSTDFQSFIDREALMLIQNLQVLSSSNRIINDLKNFGKTTEIRQNAFNIATTEHSIDKFIASWNNILDYCKGLFYTRG